MLNKVNNNLNFNNRVLRGLILVPTRELVEQVSKSLSEYGRHLKVKHTKIMGGTSRSKQAEVLSGGIDIIVATSGRLLDLNREELIDLSSINFIVLDEADTMLEMGFREEIEEIFSLCSPYRQIVMCSATVSQNIRKLAKEYLREPVTVQINDRRDRVDIIRHEAFKVDVKKKKELVAHILKTTKADQVLLFVNQKDAADAAYEYLKSQGIKIAAIHGDIEYKNRVQAIKDFRSKKIKVLVATDIAARGLDIKELPLVINYTLPESTDEFTHRVGRTGRAGNKGTVITMLTVEDYNHFSKIERNLRLNVKREVHEEFPLKDRQPRQKAMKKKVSLSEKKGFYKKQTQKDKDSEPVKTGAKSKKTTKRDAKRSFRK
ncbi:MAG: RNA helicase [Arcobacter sp.]|nr:MAG: RNA helicase [Arcobacter sp.]